MDIREGVFVVIFFITNIIMAITGFAGTMLAMPASILLIGADDARFVLNIMAILACVFIAVQQWRYANKKELAKILIVMFLGMIIGTVLYNMMPMNFLLQVYGAVIVLVALKHLIIKEERPLPGWVRILVLVAAGIIHGMFVSGGAFLGLYAALVFENKAEFRATVAATWAVLNPVFFIMNFKVSLCTSQNFMLVGVCLIPLAVSIVVGNYLHKKIGREFFMKMTYVLLIISGIVILV